ncbi:hypothetical protein ACL6C3_29970 [Capilliphycus salinus ALCB114379]
MVGIFEDYFTVSQSGKSVKILMERVANLELLDVATEVERLGG